MTNTKPARLTPAEQEALDEARIARREAERRARFGGGLTPRERAEAVWLIAGKAADVAWPGVNQHHARAAWRNDFEGGSLVASIGGRVRLTPAQLAAIAPLQSELDRLA